MSQKRASAREIIAAVRKVCGKPRGDGRFYVTVSREPNDRLDWIVFSDVFVGERSARTSARAVVRELERVTRDPAVRVRVIEDTIRYGDDCDRDVIELRLARAA